MPPGVRCNHRYKGWIGAGWCGGTVYSEGEMPLVWEGDASSYGEGAILLLRKQARAASLGGKSRGSLVHALNRVAPRKQQDYTNQDERETEP